MNYTCVPKSMFTQQVCILALCPFQSLSLGQHVKRLQSRVGCLSIQHGLSYEHCTSYGPTQEIVPELSV